MADGWCHSTTTTSYYYHHYHSTMVEWMVVPSRSSFPFSFSVPLFVPGRKGGEMVAAHRSPLFLPLE